MCLEKKKVIFNELQKSPYVLIASCLLYCPTVKYSFFWTTPPTIKETRNKGHIHEALGESHKIVQNTDDVIVLHCLFGENKLTSIKKKRARTTP